MTTTTPLTAAAFATTFTSRIWQRRDLLALDKLPTQKGGQFINLGTAYGASVKEIVDVCEQVTGKKINHTFSPRRSGDPSRLVADASKAASYLGWRPQHDLRSIVETAWNWETKKRY